MQMHHRSLTSTGASNQVLHLQMFATSLVRVNFFPQLSHVFSKKIEHALNFWDVQDFNLQSTALLDEDLSDDVSCVRRIYLETAQLSGLSFEEIFQCNIFTLIHKYTLEKSPNLFLWPLNRWWVLRLGWLHSTLCPIGHSFPLSSRLSWILVAILSRYWFSFSAVVSESNIFL